MLVVVVRCLAFVVHYVLFLVDGCCSVFDVGCSFVVLEVRCSFCSAVCRFCLGVATRCALSVCFYAVCDACGFVVPRVLFGVRCVLSLCVLVVVRWLLFFAGCSLLVARRLLLVACYLLLVARCLLCVVYRVLVVERCLSLLFSVVCCGMLVVGY